ncbi:conserved hypothetical protein [Vibrio chagasii]|nr:conserved hypothetical protein [Vibrio chagasii]
MAGLTDIEIGNFSKVFYYKDDTSKWVEVARVQSLTHPTDERNIVEVAQFGQTYPRKLAGSASVGNAEMMVNYVNADHKEIDGLYSDGTRCPFAIQVSSSGAKKDDGMHYTFWGQVASRTVAGDFDAVVTTTYSISVDAGISDWVEGIVTDATPKPDEPI